MSETETVLGSVQDLDAIAEGLRVRLAAIQTRKSALLRELEQLEDAETKFQGAVDAIDPPKKAPKQLSTGKAKNKPKPKRKHTGGQSNVPLLQRKGPGGKKTRVTQVWEFLVQHPGATAGEIVSAIGLKSPHVHHTLNQLYEHGLARYEMANDPGKDSRLRVMYAISPPD